MKSIFMFVLNAAYTLNGFDDQEWNFILAKRIFSFKTQISCLQYEASFLSSS